MPSATERYEPWAGGVTYVIGHQRPDMDAIAAALGYAWFLGQTGPGPIAAARAGQVGVQAAFALRRYGVPPPRVLSSAAPTFGHVADRLDAVSPDTPLEAAMTLLARGQRLVPVVDDHERLLGVLTPLAMATAYAHIAGGVRGEDRTCRGHMEALPALKASDRLSDHRRALLRGDGDNFLVANDAGRYVGVATRRCLLDPPRALLVLVDHNELAQAVAGADEAEIVAVLDHHRLGNAPTASPIPFVVEPVGSTSTLVAEACRRADLTPPEALAGVLLSGILSDTLVFRSPTAGDRDRQAAEWLAAASRTRIPEYGQELIRASPGLADRSAKEVVDADRKGYDMAGHSVSVAQVEVTGFEELPEHRDDLLAAMEERRWQEDLGLICLMVTDVITLHSRLLCRGEEAFLSGLPFKRLGPDEFDLDGIVSRKKQLVPAIQSAMEELD